MIFITVKNKVNVIPVTRASLGTGVHDKKDLHKFTEGSISQT